MTITPTTLKNAAFAIEHDLFTDPDGANYLVKDGAIVRRWEPEHSSADSFELMVALGLNPYQGLSYISVCDASTEIFQQPIADDKFRSTRIAILVAAASIGATL